MTRRTIIALMLVAVWCGRAPGSPDLPPLEAYVGADGCRDCHIDKYDGWKKSYHSTVVQDARQNPGAILGDFARGDVDFTPDEIEFTIGGHWYQRYAKRIGGELYVLPKVWSVASHRWEDQDVWSWKKKPYDAFCIGCHATRYDPETRTFAEHTVGCESCHGPGRPHAESGGTEPIVDPSDWSNDEHDLLCASCHVRGMDPSGRYHFAVGYVPGRDLTEHFVPHRAPDGEAPRQTFLRIFREWFAGLGDGPPRACAVCGIRKERKRDRPKTVTDRCLGCHAYGNDYAAHTKHPGDLELQCLDCHREVEAMVLDPSADVHFADYYLVHRETSYEADVGTACRECHADVPPHELDRKLREWDHSGHWVRD